ncbi:MAG: hypothetical protein AAFP93_02390 [Bacteroidota bacterium]
MTKSGRITLLVQLLGYMLLQIAVAKYVVVWHTAFCFVYVGFLLSMACRQAQLTSALLMSFFIGILVDLFYDSLGVHAFACVLLTYCRPVLLKHMLPTSTQEIDFKPTWRSIGIRKFTVYALVLTLIHHGALFSWDAASNTLLWISMRKVMFSTILTGVAVSAIQGTSTLLKSR